MNSLTVIGMLFLSACMMISCSKSEQKDALSIYREIDQDAQPNSLSPKEKQNGWILLFDGIFQWLEGI